MRIPGLSLDFHPLPGAVPVALARVDSAEWYEAGRVVHDSGRKLVALWGADNRDLDGTFRMFAAYAVDSGLAVVCLSIAPSLPAEIPSYPELSGMFPVAVRDRKSVV